MPRCLELEIGWLLTVGIVCSLRFVCEFGCLCFVLELRALNCDQLSRIGPVVEGFWRFYILDCKLGKEQVNCSSESC